MTGRVFLAVAMALVICVPISVYAGNGKVPGQPFQYLQQQIDELKDQVAGYQVVEGGWLYAGRNKGLTYSSAAFCPLGMKPVGSGGEAIAWEGVYDENGNSTGSQGVIIDGVFLMVGSTPIEGWLCGVVGSSKLYGWEVSWYNNYQGPAPYIWSATHAYVVCLGKMEPEPPGGCN